MATWTIIGSSITYYLPAIEGVVNQSVRGLKTGDLLRKIQTREIDVFFDRILFYIGGNDATYHPRKGTPPLPLEDIMVNVDRIIDTVHRWNPKAHIYFYELAPRLIQYEQSKDVIHRLNLYYRKICKRQTIKGAQFTNKGGFPQLHRYQSDGIHLSDDALALMKDVTKKFIRHH